MTSSHPRASRFALPGLDGTALELEPFTELAAPLELASELRSHADTSRLANPRGARSLFELALKVCATSAEADRIHSWLSEEEGWPDHLAPAVRKAMDIHRAGGECCSVCGRDMVVPLARWVEFRHIGRTTVTVDEDGLELSRFTALGDRSQGGFPLPFLRAGCSWRCVPKKVKKMEAEAGGE
jgi:hypothetical protein